MVALLAAAAIWVVGYANSASEQRPVNKLPSPLQPLWKPEPAQILTIKALGLSEDQISHIEAIDIRWKADQKSLLKEMNAFRPVRASLGKIEGDLNGYSELSRQYDATRESYWNQAIEQLTGKQAELAEGGPK